MKPWITPETVLDRSAFYYFSKTIACSAAAKITLQLSADTRYLLTVNGNYVCEGPCISDDVFWKYETVVIPSEALNDGHNEFCVRVLYMSKESKNFFSAVRRDRPALWLEGEIVDNGAVTAFAADESWQCLTDHGCELVASQGIHPAMPPVQIVRDASDLRETGVRVYAPNNLEQGCFNMFGLADKFELEPRAIPNLKPDAPKAFIEIRRGATSLELDAGAYTTAYPTFTFKGPKDGKLRITYAECYARKAENGHLKKGLRDDASGELIGPYDTIILTGEMQTFTPYWYKAFRYVRFDFPEGTSAETAAQFYRPYFYPLADESSFACSDETRNIMWEISKNTLLCSSHETFVDCPHHEQCQYGMDSAIEAAVMMRLTRDMRLVRKAIVDLSRSQRPDGMLRAHYPSMILQVIPNFNFYWILMLEDYMLYSGDLALGFEMMPVIDRIFTFFRRNLTPDGLCAHTPGWHFTDWVPEWQGGVPLGEKKLPFTVASMIYSAGLKSAAQIAEWCGRTSLAAEYRALAEATNKAVNKHCFDAENRLYVDVVGREHTFSEHTAVWAVLSECVKGEEARALIDRTFSGETKVSHASFSFNYYTFRALEKTGLYAKYADKVFDGWRKMLALHCTTWCENPDDPRSECHGWSAAPLYENSAMILGVKPLSPAYGEVQICPDVRGYASASGSVPTPNGYIRIAWDGKTLKLSSPAGQKKHIHLPGMPELITEECELSLEY